MKQVYGYIRVSTAKQGNGVSLQEQKEAIIRYAEKNTLKIVEWYEELETAAKQGRPLFNKMVKELRSGKAGGVVIHKIDRSARNLKDWAVLGDLIDQGIDVHFAHESLDLDTRGGRLAADIQAVIASDYIRNLRDEAIKGLYGRLKQGIYPFGAPIGYINNGGGKTKTIDALKGPLIKKLFELYATGGFSLRELAKSAKTLGLRNSRGSVVTKTALSKILNNPFYAGVLKIKGHTFKGSHEPLISSKLYSRVQDVLHGKTKTKTIRHAHLFRRMIKCATCGYSLVGEKSKGNIYYRCHTQDCPVKTFREDRIEASILMTIKDIGLSDKQDQVLHEFLDVARDDWNQNQQGLVESLEMQRERVSKKLERLTDAYVENTIDKDLFEDRKEKLLIELQGIRENERDVNRQRDRIFKKVSNFLELIRSLKNSYQKAINEEKRRILKCITSNLSVNEKKLMFTIRSPFHEIQNYSNLTSCGPERDTPRTCTVRIAIASRNGDNQHSTLSSMPELARNDNSPPVDLKKERDLMKKLFDIILSYFEEETQKVEAGLLKEENTLLSPYVQENDSNTQHSLRPVPENFKRRRA